MSISDKLRDLRKSKKLTQEQIANKLGIQRSTYSNYEIGKREPDFKTVEIFADFFNCSTDYLLGREGTTLEEGKRLFLEEFQRMSKEDQEYIAGLVKRLPKV